MGRRWTREEKERESYSFWHHIIHSQYFLTVHLVINCVFFYSKVPVFSFELDAKSMTFFGTLLHAEIVYVLYD